MQAARLVLLAVLLALPACGFHSVYGTHSADSAPVAAALNNVAIDNIRDRNGQILRNDLIDRMYGKNRPDRPAYTLKVTVRNTEEDLGIQADATATRSLMNMYADFSLTDPAGKEVTHGTAHSVASFNKLDQMYGTIASRDDARQRTLHEISEQIINSLSIYFAELP